MVTRGRDREGMDLGARGGARRGELVLDEDQHLPWLEGDEDDEPPIDTGRILLFVLVLLIALGLAAGAVWWFLGEGRTAAIADGSTIEAPEGPYKTRPENPGGLIHEGTGDLSFAVGEGRSPVVRVAPPAPVLVEGEETMKAGTGEAVSGIGVQVGAFNSHADAQRGWSDLVRRTPVLEGVGHRIVEGRIDVGTVYRLQALAPTVPAANALCGQLKASGVACQAKH